MIIGAIIERFFLQKAGIHHRRARIDATFQCDVQLTLRSIDCSLMANIITAEINIIVLYNHNL